MGVAGVAVAAATIGVFLAGYFDAARSRPASPKFRQLTFQRGSIQSAAFAPDGQTVIYSAMWNGKPTPEIFSTPHRRPALPAAPTGRQPGCGYFFLRRDGHPGPPRRSLPPGEAARCWRAWQFPEARRAKFWMTCRTQAGLRTEALWPSRVTPAPAIAWSTPSAKSSTNSAGWLDYDGYPNGKQVAFIEHPLGDSRGSLMMVGTDTKGAEWGFPRTGQIWAGLARRRRKGDGGLVYRRAIPINSALWAVTPSGKVRTVLRVPGSLTIHGFARDAGIALIAHKLSPRHAGP